MIIVLVISLLLLALVFGLASISQSYAAAKQAQATIETARVAHIAGIGNLILIVLLALLILVIFGIGPDAAKHDGPQRRQTEYPTGSN